MAGRKIAFAILLLAHASWAANSGIFRGKLFRNPMVSKAGSRPQPKIDEGYNEA
jgi:hypothetical protein